MQYARTLGDGKVWEALDFSKLPDAKVEEKRRNLVCVECGEFAWYRKESIHGHPAHFCAHHKDECALKVTYIVLDEARDDATLQSDQIKASDHIKVHLDLEKGGEVDVAEVNAASEGREGGGTRFVKADDHRESAQHFTLRKILHRLVQSPAFRESKTKITLYKSNEEILLDGHVSRIVVEFSDITKESHHDRLLLYWGPIASVGWTKDKKLWLNSSSQKQDASVMIYEDVAEEFLRLFRINNPIDDLLGAHVLVYGRCYYSTNSGKPTIRCGTSKYIFVRRYRDDRLGV